MSMNSAMPYLDCSRPSPDCLTPPKGATSLVMATSFRPICCVCVRARVCVRTRVWACQCVLCVIVRTRVYIYVCSECTVCVYDIEDLKEKEHLPESESQAPTPSRNPLPPTPTHPRPTHPPHARPYHAELQLLRHAPRPAQVTCVEVGSQPVLCRCVLKSTRKHCAKKVHAMQQSICVGVVVCKDWYREVQRSRQQVWCCPYTGGCGCVCVWGGDGPPCERFVSKMEVEGERGLSSSLYCIGVGLLWAGIYKPPCNPSRSCPSCLSSTPPPPPTCGVGQQHRLLVTGEPEQRDERAERLLLEAAPAGRGSKRVVVVCGVSVC